MLRTAFHVLPCFFDQRIGSKDISGSRGQYSWIGFGPVDWRYLAQAHCEYPPIAFSQDVDVLLSHVQETGCLGNMDVEIKSFKDPRRITLLTCYPNQILLRIMALGTRYHC